MENYLNKVLDNRYEIDEVIGTGGMAVVYRARDRKLNRLVAVKVLKEELRSDEDLRRRFHAESEAMARLNQNNIIKVFDVSSSSENEYFVMEIVDGITLKQYINQREVLSIKEALHFTLQILKALEHAHHKKIVHRDIKPQNIMILRDGTVKVMDFGIARVMEAKDITQTKGAAFGTVHYIAPEQARGENIDGRADIYSVGVMLYEMLTGQLPFTGDSPLAVAMQHINSVPEPPGKLNPNIPESLEIITLKAMCGDLNTRYHNASEMIDEIEGFRKDPVGFIPKGNYVHGANGDTIKFEPYSIASAAEASGKSSVRKREKAEKPAGEKKKVSFFPIVATLAALMLLAAVAITLWITILSPEAGSDDIPVPYLVGRTYESIVNDDTLDFEFVIKEEVYNAAYDAGVVVKQDKVSGSTAKEGSKIELTLSLGPRTAEMPDYHNWLYTTANSDLKALMDKSVTIQFEFISSSSVEKYYIVSTTPIAGDTIVEGSTVIFQISSGNDLETVEVPQLEGRSLDDARNMLYAAGLNIGDIDYAVSETDDIGTVISQSSPANNFVPKGTSVNLVVCIEATTAATTENNNNYSPGQWTYDPEVTTTGYVTVELPTSSYYPDRFFFEVYADGVRVFAETMEKGQEAVTLEVAGYGVKLIEVYIDSVLWTSQYIKVGE